MLCLHLSTDIHEYTECEWVCVNHKTGIHECTECEWVCVNDKTGIHECTECEWVCANPKTGIHECTECEWVFANPKTGICECTECKWVCGVVCSRNRSLFSISVAYRNHRALRMHVCALHFHMESSQMALDGGGPSSCTPLYSDYHRCLLIAECG